MPKKIIISLVSDQAIPNILFIKEKGFADFYYFITTQIMEDRKVVDNTIKSLNLDKSKVKKILVTEDSIRDIDYKLDKELEFNDDDDILINITGGTKIMSLAVYNFFTRNGAGEIFYVPIGKNEIRQIFPLRKNRTNVISQRLNLLEYLTAYGVEVQASSLKKKNTLLKTEKETTNLFNTFISSQRQELFEAAEAIRINEYRGKKILSNSDSDEEKELFEKARIFNDIGMNWKNENEISKDETKYITGEWLEEFVYPRIKKWLNKTDDEIALGLQLVKKNSPNEYDIMFTHNNALYVIECKTDVSDNSEGKISYLYTNTLYKAATLKKEFGLWVNYYLFALNDFSKLDENQKTRAQQLDIKLVGLEILHDDNKFEEFIKK